MPEHPHFARFYERMLSGTEKAGLADMRRDLLAGAEGRTIEIGAGTGLNLPYYTTSVSHLTLTEPDPHMARRMRERLASDGPPAGMETEVLEAGAEALPFEDESFDTAVATLVLCTVPEIQASLSEIRRVLVEGGALLVLEHIRGEGPVRSWWQDRLDRPWGAVAGGCHPNRPTADRLAEAGFWIDSMEPTEMPKAPPWMKPMIVGRASRPR
ncbi:MAG: class I SAM-dependent methyltransferase [Solirubrobacterales bacterium]|nr:class I SAM-dependent methyltransferase [Solirubrobacterales bacterium]